MWPVSGAVSSIGIAKPKRFCRCATSSGIKSNWHFGGDGDRVIGQHELLQGLMTELVRRRCRQHQMRDASGKVLFFPNGDLFQVEA